MVLAIENVGRTLVPVSSIAWLGLCAAPAGDPPEANWTNNPEHHIHERRNAMDTARGWRVSNNQRALDKKKQYREECETRCNIDRSSGSLRTL